MARKHYGKAQVTEANIHYDKWMDTLRKENEGIVSPNHLNRVAKTIVQKCDPSQYLLSHATIVSSVDTYEPRGAKIGKSRLHGVEIDIRFPDFRVTPTTHKYINNNFDCFSRGVLLTTYKTFVGAQNYLEHIQVPELSKGFIVDAVARDLGDTVYIDILVATSRIHKQLVDDIISGKMNSMSMGTQSLFTICNKCGNVASDDASICPCISYIGKGTLFQDEDGVEHPICELIGHATVPNSNHFIEASWVGNPAFSGATRRNLLNPESKVSPEQLTEAKISSEIRSSSPVDLDAVWSRAASTIRTAEDEEQDGPALDAEEPSEESPEDDGSDPDSEGDEQSVDKMIQEAKDALTHKLLQSILDSIGPKPHDVPLVSPSAPINLENGNDNLQHASTFDRRFASVFSNPSVLNRAKRIYSKISSGKANEISFHDHVFYNYTIMSVSGKKPNLEVFATVGKLGSIEKFPSETSYIACVEKRLARKLTDSEKQSVLICVRSSTRSDR